MDTQKRILLGEEQELTLKEILSFSGSISRSLFRALFVFIVGLKIILVFIPAVIVTVLQGRGARRIIEDEYKIELLEIIQPIFYTIGYPILSLILLLLIIKRIRDTGKHPLLFLVPVYNLYLLFFVPSKWGKM